MKQGKPEVPQVREKFITDDGNGPTAVALHLEKADPWVYGALINELWSVAGDGGRPGLLAHCCDVTFFRPRVSDGSSPKQSL